jgi:vesicle transport through interaction with t-SNAREs protein 1
VLERTGESLARAQQVAVETDAVGEGIIGDLGAQRETLERTRTRLVETDVELGRSRRVLRKMYLNVLTNKIALIIIIVIEVCILGGLLYWKFGTKHG